MYLPLPAFGFSGQGFSESSEISHFLPRLHLQVLVKQVSLACFQDVSQARSSPSSSIQPVHTVVVVVVVVVVVEVVVVG